MRNCFDWNRNKVTKQISVDYAKKTCQCPQLQIEVNFNSFYQHVECPPPVPQPKGKMNNQNILQLLNIVSSSVVIICFTDLHCCKGCLKR